MGRSRKFRPELFTDPAEYEEVPLRDRKRNLPALKDKREKAEFVRDVIALANTSVCLQETGYLLFGLDDQGKVRDLTDDLQQFGCADDPLNTWEQVRRRMSQLIEEYVEPELVELELKWGHVSDRLVSYLQICPGSGSVYRVQHDLGGIRTGLRSGQSWVRCGESKHQVGPSAFQGERPLLILPSKWLAYFEELLAKDIIARAEQLSAYQTLHTAEEGEALSDAIRKFLESRRQKLFIIGDAGIGKSSFLCRLVAEWAKAGRSAMLEIRKCVEFRPPPEWVPIYYPLRNREITGHGDLAKSLANEVKWIANIPMPQGCPPERLFELRDVHWLVCFDGLDELWDTEQQRAFLAAVNELRRYHYIKVIITSRPDTSIPAPAGSVLHVAPLSYNQIVSYLEGNLTGPGLLEELLNLLDQCPEFLEICAIPSYLEAVVDSMSETPPAILEPSMQSESAENSTTSFPFDREQVDGQDLLVSGVDVEPLLYEGDPVMPEDQHEEVQETRPEFEEDAILPLGWLLDRAIDKLWEREVNRKLVRLDSAHLWWDSICELALDMDGHRSALRMKELSERLCLDCRQWVLSLGLIRRKHKGWFRFFTQLLKVYFAADLLRTLLEEDCAPEAQSYLEHCKPEFRDKVRTILEGITFRNLAPLFEEVRT